MTRTWVVRFGRLLTLLGLFTPTAAGRRQCHKVPTRKSSAPSPAPRPSALPPTGPSLAFFSKLCYNMQYNQQSPRHHRGLVLTDRRDVATTSINTQPLAAWQPPGLLHPSVRQAVLLWNHSADRRTFPHWEQRGSHDGLRDGKMIHPTGSARMPGKGTSQKNSGICISLLLSQNLSS